MAERAHTVPVASPQRANAGVENQHQGEESKPNTAKRAHTTLVGTPAKKARRANVFFVGSSPHEPRGGARTEVPEKKAEAKKEAKEEAEEEPPVRAYPERPVTPPLLPENSVKGTLFTGRDHGAAANRDSLSSGG
ncbi:hypothetical protein DIPPA_30034 [Diplonema papillatum]|nr:hypothetical protein DIPPA_30034 [Diplonema papillatum]